MTDRLEIRLERNLAAQAQALPSLPDKHLRADPLDQPVSARATWPGPVAVAVAAVAVLLLIGGPVWLLTRAPGSLEPAAPDGSPTTEVPVEWSRSDFAPDGWSLYPIASSNLGTVVIGQSRQDSDAKGWFSLDGTNWEEIDTFDGGAVIRDLTSGSFGFLASGLRLRGTEATVTTLGDGPRAPSPTSTIWYSPDGTSWTETALPLPPVEDRLSDEVRYYFGRTAGNSHVMVAAGDETDESGVDDTTEGEQVIPSRPVVWWSQDGSTWQLVDEPAWDEATSATAIASTSDRVAVVVAFGGESPYSTLWTSLDGRNWELTHEFEPAVFCELVGSTQGLLAVCNDGTSRFSLDGTVWETSYLLSEGQRIGLVTGDEHGFAAILVPSDIDPFETDISQMTAAVYASSDGRQWEPISEPDTFGSGFQPVDIGSSNRGYDMVGNRFEPDAVMTDPFRSSESETWIGVPQN